MIHLNKKLIDELIKVDNNLIVPNYLIKYIVKLDLNIEEFIILLYFINRRDKIIFNIEKISKELYMDENTILEIINSLTEKKYISIEMSKENGVIEEFISLDLFFSKISSLLINETQKNDNNDIYSKFEKEFGRTLSPIEYETINKWIESNIESELIESALKEAVLNGVNSIRYIDKILFEWNKKGYKTARDVVNNKTKEDYVEEIYDYDWLNE